MVTGSLFSPPFLYRPDEEIGSNWAGNYHYQAKKLHEPDNIAKVRELVEKSDKISVLGSRHSFNSIADSPEDLISLKNFKEVTSLNPDKQTVTVAARMKYGELARHLHKNGFGLHNLASLPHISVAGACATATHGSGIKNGNLATAVSGVELITANGTKRTLTREQDGEEFSGVIVGLGGPGIVTRVTLDVEPTYDMKQYVYRDLSLNHLKDHFNEIMSTGYSVSLFTDWKSDTINQVWVKKRVAESNSGDLPDQLFDAAPAGDHLHPIDGVSAENCTRQLGIPGPWHERLPHFRMDFTPSSGDELQSEYFVPREHAYEAISEIYKLREQIAPHLLISEIRTIAADELWMSPCYRQPSVTIHFTWKPDWPSVKKVLPEIEDRLTRFNVKPHWGKLFTVSPGILQSRYERLSDFRELLAEYDPEGKFRNNFLDKYIFS